MIKSERLYYPIPTGELGDQGTGEQSTWRDSLPDTLPEDIRNSKSLDNIKDISDLVTQHVNAQSLIGNSLRIPSENAGQEDRQKFYDKVLKHAPDLMPKPNLEDEAAMNMVYSQLGRPADSGSYQLEGVTLPDDMKKAAHEAGLTQEQFEKVYSNFVKPSLDANTQHLSKVKEGREALAKEWGFAFQTKEQQAHAILQKTNAPTALVQAAANGELNAETLKWVDGLVTSIGKEGLDAVNHGEASGRMTPAEAKAQIQEILNNPDYRNAKSVNQKPLMQKMIDLQRISRQ